MLYGSSIVPATIIVGVREVQIGELVRRAFAESGLEEKSWNELPCLDREARIAKAIYDMRDEAARHPYPEVSLADCSTPGCFATEGHLPPCCDSTGKRIQT
jgi:hypothetical protein